MKGSILWAASAVLVLAGTADVYDLYNKGAYAEACIQGSKILPFNRQNEDLASAVGFACLKSDYIDLLSGPVMYLRRTEEGRTNAAYFAAVLLQKKLLLHAVADGKEIGGLNLPATDFLLSRIFHKYASGDYLKEGEWYVMNDGGETFRMRLIEEEGYKKLQVRVYKDRVMTGDHLYW